MFAEWFVFLLRSLQFLNYLTCLCFFFYFKGNQQCTERSLGTTGNKQPLAQNEPQSSLHVSLYLNPCCHCGTPADRSFPSRIQSTDGDWD